MEPGADLLPDEAFEVLSFCCMKYFLLADAAE